MINPVSSPAYTPVSSASKGADVAMNQAEMNAATLGAQTNLTGTPAKKAQATQGENIINILKNVFELKGLGILEFLIIL
ncbi:hypothetical protein [Campylobacter sp.]|uniref:hypothetical protein n=1 Tax=Campylobacter sp. TaxID=205 RepID=UPI002A763824|nr:hypothetical protein [Campylobacter sp.]MDY3245870.1 hypothetical protein [Campylobacter sp.]